MPVKSYLFFFRSKSDSFPHHLLPHIVPAGKVVGHTLEVPGIPKDIPVLVAMGDVQCAMQAVLNSPQDAGMGGKISNFWCILMLFSVIKK